jgi:hypothetical protein
MAVMFECRRITSRVKKFHSLDEANSPTFASGLSSGWPEAELRIVPHQFLII